MYVLFLIFLPWFYLQYFALCLSANAPIINCLCVHACVCLFTISVFVVCVKKRDHSQGQQSTTTSAIVTRLASIWRARRRLLKSWATHTRLRLQLRASEWDMPVHERQTAACAPIPLPLHTLRTNHIPICVSASVSMVRVRRWLPSAGWLELRAHGTAHFPSAAEPVPGVWMGDWNRVYLTAFSVSFAFRK